MELSAEQKMEMSLEDIIWYEKQLLNLEGLSSASKSTSSRSGHQDRPFHSPIRYDNRSQNYHAHYRQCRNKCVHGSQFRFNFPRYRKSVQKAVQTLRSRSQQGFRYVPYKKRTNQMAGIGVSIPNDDYMNNNFAKNYRNSDGTMDLELPVKNNFNCDFRRIPKFLFMGTKVVVTRHSIKNKLNSRIQKEMKELAEGKSDREKLYTDLDFCPMPHTTSLLINERFTLNG